jgi:hypothetical protein
MPPGTELGILAFAICLLKKITGGMMQRFFLKVFFPVALLAMALLLVRIQGAQAYESGNGLNQQPTVAIPTVTGTPIGPYIIVVSDPEDQINVRSGPGTEYPKIGVLLNRQQAPAVGRLPGSWSHIRALKEDRAGSMRL